MRNNTLATRTLEQKKAGLITAHILVDINAVSYCPQQPYVLTSGWVSPIYIDCRKIISYPYARKVIIQLAVWTILYEIGYTMIDAIAGGETAGISYAAWIAEELNLPMLYVRKQSKGFGRNTLIEGYLVPGARVLLVEDLITDGSSKSRFCKVLREAGTIVDHTIAMFSYDIFPEAIQTMRAINLHLHYLANLLDILEALEKKKVFHDTDLKEIQFFLHDPVIWSAKHGGRFR